MFAQERTLSRLQQRIRREHALLACFLVGSFGRRDQDDFADLDLYLVYHSSAAKHLAYQERQGLATSILPYVPARTWERPDGISALYANGSKIDFVYAARDELVPAPQFRQIYILQDADDWAAELARRSATVAAPLLPPPETSDLERLDNRFWLSFWDVWRRLQRGDVDTPFVGYLELLAGVLPVLLAHLPPEDPAAAGLVNIVYTRDAATTRENLRDLVEGYVRARAAVAGRYRLSYRPDSPFENELRQLLAR